MSSLVYKDQSAALLCLVLAGGPINTGQFEIVEEGCLRGETTSVTARIIGASHFITFDTGERVLHEIFACQPVHAHELVHRATIAQAADGIDLGGIGYRFAAETVGSEHEAHLAGWADLLVEYEFPETPNGEIPKTIVAVHRDASAYEVKTAHIYPNEGKTVLTSSRLVLPYQRDSWRKEIK